MDQKQNQPEDASLLSTTPSGWVRHCACRDVLVMQFLDYWLALPPADFLAFHERLAGTVGCPLGRKRLAEGGRYAFRTEKGAIAFLLDEAKIRELLWLLDSARFMLEARDAAAKGFAERAV